MGPTQERDEDSDLMVGPRTYVARRELLSIWRPFPFLFFISFKILLRWRSVFIPQHTSHTGHMPRGLPLSLSLLLIPRLLFPFILLSPLPFPSFALPARFKYVQKGVQNPRSEKKKKNQLPWLQREIKTLFFFFCIT